LPFIIKISEVLINKGIKFALDLGNTGTNLLIHKVKVILKMVAGVIIA